MIQEILCSWLPLPEFYCSSMLKHSRMLVLKLCGMIRKKIQSPSGSLTPIRNITLVNDINRKVYGRLNSTSSWSPQRSLLFFLYYRKLWHLLIVDKVVLYFNPHLYVQLWSVWTEFCIINQIASGFMLTVVRSPHYCKHLRCIVIDEVSYFIFD